METLMIIEQGEKGVRQPTILAVRDGDVNKISVYYNSVQGQINRSGAILCRKIEAEKIMKKEKEVSDLMKRLFPDSFKELYIASTDGLNIPSKQNKRDVYFKQ